MCTINSLGKSIPFILKLLKRVPLERNHRLGVELGISPYRLNEIEVDYKGDSENIRIEIVQKWLNSDGIITLRFLEKTAHKLCKLVLNGSS